MCLKMGEKIWIEDPSVLFRSLNVFPNADMTEEERFNAITRLIIVITILLFFLGYKQWLVFLIASIVVLLIVYFSKKPTVVEHYKDTEVKIEPRKPQYFIMHGPIRIIKNDGYELYVNMMANQKNIFDKHSGKEKEIPDNTTRYNY